MHPDADSSLKDMLTDKETGRLLEDHPLLYFGLYSDMMTKWADYFQISQMHITGISNLRRDPISTLHRVERFLDLDDNIKQSDFTINVATKTVCPKSEHVKCVFETDIDYSQFDPSFLHSLRTFYAPHNKDFFTKIGQKYDWPSS